MNPESDHLSTLRLALELARHPDASPVTCDEVDRLSGICREYIARGIDVGMAPSVPKVASPALQAFIDLQGWRRHPGVERHLLRLFGDYVRAGFIRVDGPDAAPMHPETGKPLHWRPLEQAVVTGAVDTMLALIDNGARSQLVDGGDVLAFIRSTQTALMAPVMVGLAARAFMERRIGELAAAPSEPGTAKPARRRLLRV